MQMKVVRSMALAVAAMAVAPGAAHAAQVTVTGDDGNPVALNPAAPVALRNVSPEVTVNKDLADGYMTIATLDPSGVVAGGEDGSYCWSIGGVNDHPSYRGNGTYTVVVNVYPGTDCSVAPKATLRMQYTLGAGVAMTAPPGPVLTRNANSASTISHDIPFTPNPGMGSYEVRYARGGVIAPDGSISGPSSTAFVDQTRSTVSATFDRPGTYTFVARGGEDSYFTPWSTPIQVRALAPFDFESINFPDSRGPSYRLRAKLGERTASGRVYISYARGSKRGKYHSLGYSRISKAGTISKRFRLRRTGTYRLRYRFKGSSTTAGGTVVTKIRITRRIVF